MQARLAFARMTGWSTSFWPNVLRLHAYSVDGEHDVGLVREESEPETSPGGCAAGPETAERA